MTVKSFGDGCGYRDLLEVVHTYIFLPRSPGKVLRLLRRPVIYKGCAHHPKSLFYPGHQGKLYIYHATQRNDVIMCGLTRPIIYRGRVYHTRPWVDPHHQGSGGYRYLLRLFAHPLVKFKYVKTSK